LSVKNQKSALSRTLWSSLKPKNAIYFYDTL
jgi:hypothetical protein